MANRYCYLEDDFTNPVNVGDTSGNPASGMGGLKSMIEGWGNHDVLVPGDILYLKGTGAAEKFVKIVVDVDKTGTWVIGDDVENHIDAGNGGRSNGDAWTGFLVYIDAITVWVQIENASGDVDDVNDDDGIYNDTQAEEIAGANMTSHSAPGAELTGSGTDGSPIQFIGVDSSWSNNGTKAVIDGNGKATNCLVGDNVDHIWMENITFQNAADDNVAVVDGNYCYYCIFLHCLFQNAGAKGLDRSPDNSKGFSRSIFVYCQSLSNTTDGFHATIGCIFRGCVASDNGAYGFVGNSLNQQVVDCVVHNNTGTGVQVWAGNIIHGCVIDANGTRGIYATVGPVLVSGNAITNNGTYGIETDGGATVLDLNNFFSNNTSGRTNGATVYSEDKGVNTQIDELDTVSPIGIYTGTTGYLDLPTPAGYLNDLRASEFAICQWFNVKPAAANWTRILSIETAADAGLAFVRTSTANGLRFQWSGTATINYAPTSVVEGEAHSMSIICDGSDARCYLDNRNLTTDPYSGLAAVDAGKIRLGEYAFSTGKNCAATNGLLAILDLTSAGTIDSAMYAGIAAAWKTAKMDLDKFGELLILLLGSGETISGICWKLDELAAYETSSDANVLKRYDLSVSDSASSVSLAATDGDCTNAVGRAVENLGKYKDWDGDKFVRRLGADGYRTTVDLDDDNEISFCPGLPTMVLPRIGNN